MCLLGVKQKKTGIYSYTACIAPRKVYKIKLNCPALDMERVNYKKKR